MVRLRPVILALLLALAGPVAAVPTSAPTVQPSATTTIDTQVYAAENTSAVLTLGENADEKRTFATASLDLGTALAIEKDAMDLRLTSQSFARHFSQADTRAQKRDSLLRYVTSIDTRTTQLERREQSARQSYRNGSISASEYVRTLARIDAEASQLREIVRQIATYTDEVPQFTLSDLLGQLDKRLVSLKGTVRDRVSTAATGEEPAVKVYVAAADNGVILSTITEGTYYRELYRSDHRNTDSQGTLNVTRQIRILRELYPYATKQAEENYGSELHPNPRAGYNRFILDFGHGELQGYLDVGTEQVFRESQHKDVSTMPKGPGVTANESGLILTVNRSYPGGPMYVALRDNETGKFVEGTIAIDGETVGHTSADGGLWALSPAGSFNVSASHGLAVVAVQTRATRPIKNYNASER